jgi:hypothetical protein
MWFRSAAAHPAISFLIPFSMVLFGRLVLFGDVPPPQPLIQDEFSYLLAGDTFASFRVTNPTHRLWEHFETIHVLVWPSYMSKYPPMQGIVLAFGQLIFGEPWTGVILNMAVFCGLLPWTFRAWVPSDWALAGASLATYKIGILSYWTDSYWGGGAAAVGGALVLGSVGRLGLVSTPGMAAIFVLGGGILGNSRPFEGLVFLLGCGVYLSWIWFGAGRWRRTWPGYPRHFVPAACLVALPILLAMGYYNRQITGSATVLPYQAYERQYAVFTPFVWQQAPSPEPLYRHEFIRRAWIEWDRTHKTMERKHWPRIHRANAGMILDFYFGTTFVSGGVLFIPALFVGSRNRSILFLLMFDYCCTRVMSDIIPHYTAPAAALIYLAATATLRTGWAYSPLGLPLGKAWCVWVLAHFLTCTTVLFSCDANRFLYYKPHLIEKRQRVLSFLDRQPGSQLVFVNHGPLHDPNDIWVFNRADIDASRIVWANSMKPAENRRVLDYYGPRRTAWMLDDDAELTLRPYGRPTAGPSIRIKNPPLPPLLQE